MNYEVRRAPSVTVELTRDEAVRLANFLRRVAEERAILCQALEDLGGS